jgi:hypothetical protein
MHFLIAALASIAGTLLMTSYLYLLAYLTKKNFRVVHVLGLMLTKPNASPHKMLIVGTLVHYTIGVLFALIYAWLWQEGIGRPDTLNGLLLGAFSGLFAMVFWQMFIVLHENPPLLPLPAYQLAVGAGHLLFGLGTTWMYGCFVPS